MIRYQKVLFRILPLIGVALICCSIMQAQQSVLIDKVIAKVGGEHILYSELQQAVNYQKEKNPNFDDSFSCQILEQIIAQKILVDQAKLDSIVVQDDEIESQLDFRINNILSMMNGDAAAFESYYGKSIPQVKDQMRDDLRQQILAQRIQQKLISEVSITPKEVIAFYHTIPADSLPYLSSEVEIAEIQMKPKSNDEQNQKTIEKLNEIRAQIMSGASTFEEMAAQHGMDGTSVKGGDLGWQKRGTFVQEFEAVAYNLEQDEVSEVVETEFGYHLIKLIGRRGNTINTKHILIIPEIVESDKEKTRTELARIRSVILSDSLSFEAAVKLFSDKKSMSYNNNGRLQNQATGTNFFETGELAPEIYFEIESLELGDITEPVESANERSETVFKIFKLVSRTRPHKANLEQDYSRIQTFAKESKKNEYFNEWMDQRLKNAFIHLEGDLAQCPNLQSFIN